MPEYLVQLTVIFPEGNVAVFHVGWQTVQTIGFVAAILGKTGTDIDLQPVRIDANARWLMSHSHSDCPLQWHAIGCEPAL